MKSVRNLNHLKARDARLGEALQDLEDNQSSVQFADGDLLQGAVDGKNVVFVLPHAPYPAESLQLFDGPNLLHGYQLNGRTVTLTAPPSQGLKAWHRWSK